MISFLTESGKNFKETETIGGFNSNNKNTTYDEFFREACDDLMAAGITYGTDINTIIKNPAMLETVKDHLLGTLYTECENADEDNCGFHEGLYDQCSTLFDNAVANLVSESTRIGTLLPIKAIDLPIVVKQHLAVATKDIMQTEVTKSPVIKKQIQKQWIVDPKSKKRWQYPQCFFNDEFKEIYLAGKGVPIDETPQELPLFNKDIVADLTKGLGDKDRDKITTNLKITKVIDEANHVIPVNMYINLADGSWIGGRINKTMTFPKAEGTDGETEEVTINDCLTGYTDFTNNTTTITSAAGTIKKVVFSGFLSNELNERYVSWDYSREDMEFKIEDGHRVDVPYSLEELEDAKALLDMDLYQMTYNNISDYLVQMEDSNTLSWLDEQFEKYDGVELDPLDFTSIISKTVFDCDSTTSTTALPCEFIEKMLKFKIDRFIIDMCDRSKLENVTFVIYGNPRYISLLEPSVTWVTRPGSTANGVRLDYSYGLMTSGDVKVQVVSTKKVNMKYDSKDKIHRGLRIIPFPLDKDQFTFKHYKHSTHILTTQNSGYRAADRPGGSMTNIMGVSRYENAAIQGIQGEVAFANADFIGIR